VFVEAVFCLNDFVRVCLCWDGVCLCVWEGVCFGGLCVVCMLVLSRWMLWCALCWGMVWPGCWSECC